MAATLKTKIKDIETLKASRGWQRIRSIMHEEMIEAARQIAKNPNMTEKEVDFRRGAIWAAEKLLEVPDAILLQLKNEQALEDLSKQDPAPKDTGDDT